VNKHETTIAETATIRAEGDAREQDTFQVHEEASDDLEVVELENAPLTDINFGF
jgi:hypothetical protein